jgi:hypothetical protein
MGAQAREDEYEIGRSAIRYKIPVITTIAGAQAAVRGIRNKIAKINISNNFMHKIKPK